MKVWVQMRVQVTTIWVVQPKKGRARVVLRASLWSRREGDKMTALEDDKMTVMNRWIALSWAADRFCLTI